MRVRPSADEVESLTRPLHRMKTPRADCPSTNSVAPLGYTAAEVMEESACTAAGGRLQKSRSSRWGQERQLSIISKPYGARIASLPRSIPPSTRWTKRNPLGIGFGSLNKPYGNFYTGGGSRSVTAVTMACDERRRAARGQVPASP